jgi:putative ABC transport system ATP-binding protein
LDLLAPAVLLRNVSKSYLPRGSGSSRGSLVRALDDISIEIEQGDFVAITGPSGSGKSTLMNLMGCLDFPTEGEVYLNGRLVNGLSGNELSRIRRENVGFVFQSFNLLPKLTALENVTLAMAFGGKLSRSERDEHGRGLLEMMGLGGKEGSFPNELSGGEGQRVAIARALANDPGIILADEPTGNLDSRSGRQVLDILEDLNQIRQVTVVVVTHDESIAREAGRRVRLKDGRLDVAMVAAMAEMRPLESA